MNQHSFHSERSINLFAAVTLQLEKMSHMNSLHPPGGLTLKVTMLLVISESVLGFQPIIKTRSSFLGMATPNNLHHDSDRQSFDPLGLASAPDDQLRSNQQRNQHIVLAATTTSALSVLSFLPNAALAAANPLSSMISTDQFDPKNFQPVCSASDGFYRFLQSSTQAIVGPENFREYAPLIAGGLLRVRLELCVVESFFNEAVGPFIQQNGVSWILPLHETVETFLAGSIFALATTFILVGSTKIVTVIVTYVDFLVGAPFRLFGGFSFDRARGKPVTLDIGIGRFKARVIGPKDLETAEKNDYSVDFTDKELPAMAVIVISGGVKAAGQAIEVSAGKQYRLFHGLFYCSISNGFASLYPFVLHFYRFYGRS
jgi:hypothetical protein